MNAKLSVLFSVVIACQAAAHHSHGNYDITQWTPLTGTVTEVHLINPHSWIYLEVEDDPGEHSIWALEAALPRFLFRNGIEPDDVRPGDAIRVRCHLLKDGGKGCLLGYVTPLHGDPERGHGIEKEWD